MDYKTGCKERKISLIGHKVRNLAVNQSLTFSYLNLLSPFIISKSDPSKRIIQSKNLNYAHFSLRVTNRKEESEKGGGKGAKQKETVE